MSNQIVINIVKREWGGVLSQALWMILRSLLSWAR